jgi:branched-chain amino acid transport system substrate-binding protein
MGKAGWRGETLYGVNQERTFPIGLGMIVDGQMQPVQTIQISTE